VLTKDNLKELPLRAIVTLVVRAVRRERPSFDLTGATSDRGRLMAGLDNSLAVAARFASGAALDSDALEKAGVASEAAAATPSDMFGVAATHAAFAVAVAQQAAKGEPELALNFAWRCVSGAIKAYAHALNKDFNRARARGFGQFPELGASVDTSAAGPLGALWPDGPPE
jgi:hypothetical protein